MHWIKIPDPDRPEGERYLNLADVLHVAFATGPRGTLLRLVGASEVTLSHPTQIEVVLERLELLSALAVMPCDYCDGDGVVARIDGEELLRPMRCGSCRGTGKAVH